LAAAALFVSVSVGLASQANAGLSLSDPTAGEAMAAARKAEVCLPEKAVTTVRQKSKVRKAVAMNRPQGRIQFPLLLGVAY
jgi:hypothetical protein